MTDENGVLLGKKCGDDSVFPLEFVCTVHVIRGEWLTTPHGPKRDLRIPGNPRT